MNNYPCIYEGQAADGRAVTWERGEWSGDADLIRQADALRGADDSMRSLAAAIAEAVGADGQVSASVRAAMEV